VLQYSPYVQKANKEYIIPAYNAAYISYNKYGEPYVSKSSKFAAAEYDRYLKPHVEIARRKAETYYTIYVSPHAETVNKIWINDVKPTVDIAREKAEVFWHDHALPSYNKVQPYLAKAYGHGKYVITVIVAPIVREGGEKAVGWGRGMWSEVVRPQVGRIGERLGGTNGSGYVSFPGIQCDSLVVAADRQQSPCQLCLVVGLFSTRGSKALWRSSLTGFDFVHDCVSFRCQGF